MVTATVAQRLKGLSAVATAAARFKNLRKGWQVSARSSSAAPAETQHSEIGETAAESCGEEAIRGGHAAFWTLPSTLANYVELDLAETETTTHLAAIGNQNPESIATEVKQSQGLLGARRLSSKVALAAQRTQELSSGLFQQACGIAAGATRSRTASAAETSTSSALEDAVFATGSDEAAFAIGSDDDYETSTVSADSPTRRPSERSPVAAEDDIMCKSLGDSREYVTPHCDPEASVPDPGEAGMEGLCGDDADTTALEREESF